MTAAIPEKWEPTTLLGKGQRGEVYATRDRTVVCKITRDPTEAKGAALLLKEPAWPAGIMQHFLVRKTGAGETALWRRRVDKRFDYGMLDKYDLPNGDNPLLNAWAQSWEYGNLLYNGGSPAEMMRWRQRYLRAALAMTRFRETKDLGKSLVRLMMSRGIYFGDMHDLNFGVLGGKFVLTDLGMTAVLSRP